MRMFQSRIAAAVLWIAVAATILIWTLAAYNGETSPVFRGEILIRHGLIMLALSMPSGFILLFILGMIMGWFGISITGIVDAVFASIACGVAGYVQWFVLMPWLWRRWKAKHIEKPLHE